MKFTKIHGFGAVLVAAAVALAAFGTAGSASAGSRPFKGTAHGGVTGGLGPILVLDYTGNAPHLGNFTRRERVSLAALPAITGKIRFEAANGDALFVTLDGAFTSLVPPLLEANGTYTITGGTGRFEDATGTATFYASGPNLGDVTVSWNGTIDY